MTLMKWSSPKEVERWFEEFFGAPALPRSWRRFASLKGFKDLEGMYPAVDMYDRKDEIVVKADIPGVQKENVHISLSDSMGGTAIKVLRGSSIPVLTTREAKRSLDIKRILVPTDLAHGLVNDFGFARELAREFGATIHLLNAVEVGEHGFPLEIAEQMRAFSLREIEENIGKARVSENITASVETAKNAWKGIVKFAGEKDIDLIVMMTYGGGKFKENFIGSVAEKVIQESPCPVITKKPFPY